MFNAFTKNSAMMKSSTTHASYAKESHAGLLFVQANNLCHAGKGRIDFISNAR